ncbi:MAG TPA: sigma-70 family RNA polymerase sigma factor [Acidimicrobiia bacterium]|nr:sigma-70 family RNA polymerase sigma factor [Acidimicrobiia bacterium]
MSEASPINKRRKVGVPPNDAFPITWDEVARSHGRKIYNYAYRLCGNPHDANDLVQEVLLRVRSGLADYQPGSFEGWLWRITRNAFLDDVRRQRRRPTVSLPDEADLGFFGRYVAQSPDEVLASVSFDDDIQKALLDLPFDFREAVVMCDVVGLSYDEIATAVGVPVGTVRSRIHRGRRLLREQLA